MTPLDAARAGSREGGPSFPLSNRIVRAIWSVAWTLTARWTPKPLAPWRRVLLRAFGARMERGSDVRGGARVWLPSHLVMGEKALISAGVDCYNQAPIVLGREALVSQRAFLCAGTHDVDDPHFQLVARPITIGAGAWIAAEAFVGPGTVIGDEAVLGARSVAFGTLEAGMIYAGNPARALRRRKLADKSTRG